jgi:flagellar protein FlbB
LLVWFDFLGVIDLRGVLSPVYSLFGAPGRGGQLPSDSPTLLEDERYRKRLEEIALFREELATQEGDMLSRRMALAKTEQELEEKEKSLDEREKSLSQSMLEVENREANVERIAANLTGMRPEQAVKILLEMDDQLVIDVLRAVEARAAADGKPSIVPYWLYLMPPDRSATIQRKMTVGPTGAPTP